MFFKLYSSRVDNFSSRVVSPTSRITYIKSRLNIIIYDVRIKETK